MVSNCKWTLVSLWTHPGPVYTPHSIYGVSKLLAKTVFRAGRVRLLQSLTIRSRYRNSIACEIDSKSAFLGPSSTVQKTMIPDSGNPRPSTLHLGRKCWPGLRTLQEIPCLGSIFALCPRWGSCSRDLNHVAVHGGSNLIGFAHLVGFRPSPFS